MPQILSNKITFKGHCQSKNRAKKILCICLSVCLFVCVKATKGTSAELGGGGGGGGGAEGTWTFPHKVTWSGLSCPICLLSSQTSGYRAAVSLSDWRADLCSDAVSSSRLDSGNALQSGSSKITSCPLQSIQNSAAPGANSHQEDRTLNTYLKALTLFACQFESFIILYLVFKNIWHIWCVSSLWFRMISQVCWHWVSWLFYRAELLVFFLRGIGTAWGSESSWKW